jgi:hypothetical protein
VFCTKPINGFRIERPKAPSSFIIILDVCRIGYMHREGVRAFFNVPIDIGQDFSGIGSAGSNA